MQFLEETAKRLVVKIGTNSLAGPGGHLRPDRLRELARQVAAARGTGLDVIVISSGAVGLGTDALGLDQRPSDLASLQACAAVGQSRLMESWQQHLATHGLLAAQILLTREDVRGRRRHLAIRSTLEKLLSLGVVPIVNENDTISADEIRFGDNDVLSAMVASLIKADLLIILSTIPGLMKDQGRGELIPVVREIDDQIREMAGGARDRFSTGGMVTKIEAAELATRSGCNTFIGDAAAPDILPSILEGTAQGTFFVARSLPMAARKRWIAFFEKPMGDLHLDAGAVQALVEEHGSLLAKGVTQVSGSFLAGQVVNLRSPQGVVIARGICTFDQAHLLTALGKDSSAIRRLYPERSRVEVVHRDSMVLMPAGKSGR